MRVTALTVREYDHEPLSPFGSLSVPEIVYVPAANFAGTLTAPIEVTSRPAGELGFETKVTDPFAPFTLSWSVKFALFATVAAPANGEIWEMSPTVRA